jgi:hypothetical protein
VLDLAISVSTTAVPGGGVVASARTSRSRACASRRAASRTDRTRSSTSRSRSENWRSLRPSLATTISRRSARTPISRTRRPRVEQIAVQLAVGQAAGLNCLGQAQRRTHSGGMRGQQRMTRRVPTIAANAAGGLGLGRDRLMSHDAGSELDAIPNHLIRWHKLREARQRPASQLGHRTGSDERPGEPCAAPTSVSASQGVSSPVTVHPRSAPPPVGGLGPGPPDSVEHSAERLIPSAKVGIW